MLWVSCVSWQQVWALCVQLVSSCTGLQWLQRCQTRGVLFLPHDFKAFIVLLDKLWSLSSLWESFSCLWAHLTGEVSHCLWASILSLCPGLSCPCGPGVDTVPLGLNCFGSATKWRCVSWSDCRYWWGMPAKSHKMSIYSWTKPMQSLWDWLLVDPTQVLLGHRCWVQLAGWVLPATRTTTVPACGFLFSRIWISKTFSLCQTSKTVSSLAVTYKEGRRSFQISILKICKANEGRMTECGWVWGMWGHPQLEAGLWWGCGAPGFMVKVSSSFAHQSLASWCSPACVDPNWCPEGILICSFLILRFYLIMKYNDGALIQHCHTCQRMEKNSKWVAMVVRVNKEAVCQEISYFHRRLP